MAEIIRFKKKQVDHERYLLDALDVHKHITPANAGKLDATMMDTHIRVRQFNDIDAANWNGLIEHTEISDIFAFNCKNDKYIRFTYPKACINEMWIVNSQDGNLVFYAMVFGLPNGARPTLMRALTRTVINPILGEKLEMIINPNTDNIQRNLGELLYVANTWKGGK